MIFAGLTGAWFILGSFLALIDTTAVWWTAAAVAVVAMGLWVVGRAAVGGGPVDDLGRLDEPLTVLRLVLAALVGLCAAITLSTRRWRWLGWTARHSAAVGMVVLVVGLSATIGAAVIQAFSQEGDCARVTVPTTSAAAGSTTPTDEPSCSSD